MLRNIARVILGLIALVCAMFALSLYENFPNGGNGSGAQRAAFALELSTGIAIAAFAALLLTFRWSGRPPDAG
jgi:hypothetical protein